MNDMVYQNYIVFLYKVKSAVKRRWTGLKDEILSVQKDIQSKIDQKES